MTPKTAFLSTAIRAFTVAAFAAILFLTAALPVTRADDAVVAEMEFTIREISKETLKLARETVWASVKKTTSYAKYERAQKERKTAVSEELDKAVEDASAAWREAVNAWREFTQARPRAPEEILKRYNETAPLYDEYQKLEDQRLTILSKARGRVEVVADEVNSLVDKIRPANLPTGNDEAVDPT